MLGISSQSECFAFGVETIQQESERADDFESWDSEL
jgi:hypothetical protein